MVIKAREVEIFYVGKRINIEPKPLDKPHLVGMDNGGVEGQRLDCIYDDEPLGFEKDLVALGTKMQPQDPLEEVDLD